VGRCDPNRYGALLKRFTPLRKGRGGSRGSLPGVLWNI
jgi:hypothetical protein